MFKALLVNKTDEAGYTCTLTELDEAQLACHVAMSRCAVEWSTINYKDGLAITGKAPVVRSFPLVPGIDFAGTVTASDHPRWKVGDRVVLNGFGVGESHWGGLAQMARVKGDWLVALPDVLSTRDAMAIGTAGYTAMLCVQALQRHWNDAGMEAGSGEVLVTGAGGGVGGVAIALLSAMGHKVVASTGRLEEGAYLKSLGAAEVIDRSALSAPGKPHAERTLDRRGGFGGQPHAGQCLRQHALRRRRGGLWSGARHGFPVLGGTFYLARRDALRHRQRDGAFGQARSRLATTGRAIWTAASWQRSRKKWAGRSACRRRPAILAGRCAGGWWSTSTPDHRRRGQRFTAGRPKANQPPRGAATRAAAERGGFPWARCAGRRARWRVR